MRLSPDIELSSVLFFIVLFLGLGVFFYYLIQRDRVRFASEDWYKHTLKSLELDKYENSFILNNSNNNLVAENILIYTSDEFVYIINKINRMVKKVNKCDILKVDLNIYSTEKNVKRLIALTSTYDKSVNVTGLELKLITRNETNVILMMANGRNVDNITLFNKAQLIDDANRCKLMIENDIEKLNNLNI